MLGKADGLKMLTSDTKKGQQLPWEESNLSGGWFSRLHSDKEGSDKQKQELSKGPCRGTQQLPKQGDPEKTQFPCWGWQGGPNMPAFLSSQRLL